MNVLINFIKGLDKGYITQVFSLFDYSQMMINEKIQYKGKEINNFNYFFEIFRNSKLNVLFEDENLEFEQIFLIYF